MGESPDGREPAASVSLDPAGVVRLTWAAGLHIDENVARDAMKTVDELNGAHHRPLLVDSMGPTDISRAARKVFTERSSVTRIALVGQSAVDHLVANFVLRLSSPPVPTRFFTSESGAMAWLREDGSPT